jgi:hypothetical protein
MMPEIKPFTGAGSGILGRCGVCESGQLVCGNTVAGCGLLVACCKLLVEQPIQVVGFK